jgi:N-acetylglutamate synthase-like GNAT family acetyltransferase
MTPEFYVSTDKAKLDLDVVVDYLSNHSYWAIGRSRNTIEKSIVNSLCFGVYTHKHQQVGFARVVSDFAVFAWIMDVFVPEGYRKKGLSKWLLQEITSHAELQGLQRWGLATRDAHGLYKQYGFTRVAHPEHMMEKTGLPDNPTRTGT